MPSKRMIEWNKLEGIYTKVEQKIRRERLQSLVVIFGLIFLMAVSSEAYDAGYRQGRIDERMDKSDARKESKDDMS